MKIEIKHKRENPTGLIIAGKIEAGK